MFTLCCYLTDVSWSWSGLEKASLDNNPPWITIHLFQAFSSTIFHRQLCSGWQDFSWQRALCCASVTAESLVILLCHCRHSTVWWCINFTYLLLIAGCPLLVVSPLYAALPPSQQLKVFGPTPKVILPPLLTVFFVFSFLFYLYVFAIVVLGLVSSVLSQERS